MKFLQINLNHCEVAQLLLEQNVIEENVDIALISEQYRNKNSGEWLANNSKNVQYGAAEIRSFRLAEKKNGNGFARAHVNGIAFYSCYLPPSHSHPQAISVLEEIAEDARENRPAVIAGGAGTSSIIDLTFVSAGLVSGSSWEVSDTYMGSDHSAIFCTINSRNGPSRVPKTVSGYTIETLDVEMVQMLFENLSTSGSAKERANHIADYTKLACDASMQRKGKTPSGRRPAYWWNQSIAEARKDCHRARRAYQRSRGRPEFESLQKFFRERRRALEKTR
ncbi:hypothetical protein KR084_012537 [Drosophila pseudotakahashii]|nr:hypothetical protein KR084_012537 [Drosophila pseudotakahashii]